MAVRDMGYNALIFHYLGCWGSEGRYSLQGIPTDVKAAITALQRRQDVDPDRIVAMVTVWVDGRLS